MFTVFFHKKKPHLRLNSPRDQGFDAGFWAGKSSPVNHTLAPALQGGGGTKRASLHIRLPANAWREILQGCGGHFI